LNINLRKFNAGGTGEDIAEDIVSCSRATIDTVAEASHNLRGAVMVTRKVGRKQAARGDIAGRAAVRTLKSWPAQAASGSRVACGVATAGEVTGSTKVTKD